jgi:heme/copper-type cytochrome/quinol oxidase subunit 2
LHYEDEMAAESLNDGSGGFNPIATAVFVVVIVVIVLPMGVVIWRHRRKQAEMEKPVSTESAAKKA